MILHTHLLVACALAFSILLSITICSVYLVLSISKKRDVFNVLMLDSLLHNNPNCIYVKTEANGFVYINQLYRFLLNTVNTSILHETEKQVLQTGKELSVTCLTDREDEVTFYINRVNVFGNGYVLVGNFKEVTPYLNIVKAISMNRDKYKNSINYVSDFILELNNENSIMTVTTNMDSRIYYDATGYSPKDLVTTHLSRYITEKSYKLMAKIQDLFAGLNRDFIVSDYELYPSIDAPVVKFSVDFFTKDLKILRYKANLFPKYKNGKQDGWILGVKNANSVDNIESELKYMDLLLDNAANLIKEISTTSLSSMDVFNALTALGENISSDRVCLVQPRACCAVKNGVNKIDCDMCSVPNRCPDRVYEVAYQWVANNINILNSTYKMDLSEVLDSVKDGYTILTPDRFPTYVSFINHTTISVLIIPIYINEELFGLAAFDTYAENKVWAHSEIAVLKLIAANLGALYYTASLTKQLKQVNTGYDIMLHNMLKLTEMDTNNMIETTNRMNRSNNMYKSDKSTNIKNMGKD